MTFKENQKDEICALESIYGEEEFKVCTENGLAEGIFYAHIDIPSEFKVVCKDLRREDSTLQEFSVKYLPPICLHFKLPEDYPSHSSPTCMLSCCWLTYCEIMLLCKKLESIWKENEFVEVLFLWTQFLKEQTLSSLEITNTLDVSLLETTFSEYEEHRQARKTPHFEPETKKKKENEKATQKKSNDSDKQRNVKDGRGMPVKSKYDPDDYLSGICQNLNLDFEKKEMEFGVIHENEEDLLVSEAVKVERKSLMTNIPEMSIVQLLQEFDAARQRTEFNRNFFACKICLQDKKGLQCMYFQGCGHVFCKNCLAEYFEVRIKEGTVKNILCPEEKCSSEAVPSQVQELVSAELFSRYDSVLLANFLDTMEGGFYCPRLTCQYPIAMELGEKMATCPSCRYTFCVNCKMVYHGIEPCRLTTWEDDGEEHSEADDDERVVTEHYYTKDQRWALKQEWLCEKWINSNSKKCPKCKTNIEKFGGCNKMCCWKCNTFFCWLCQECLDPMDILFHFRNSKSKCYNLLNAIG